MGGNFPLELYTYVLKTITDVALNLNFKPKKLRRAQITSASYLLWGKNKIINVSLPKQCFNWIVLQVPLKIIVLYESCFTYPLSNPRLL